MPPSQGAAAKPLSERDFFDLLTPLSASSELPFVLVQEQVAQPALSNEASCAPTGNTDNLVRFGNPSKGEKTDNTVKSAGRKQKAKRASPDNSGNTGSGEKPSKPDKVEKPDNLVLSGTLAEAEPTLADKNVRQTFVVRHRYLDQLLDYVHARRASGDYAYSQKQALEEAFDLLFAQTPLAAPRPEQVRVKEKQHKELIRRGKKTRE
jgi:hypothetical protein